MTTTPTRSVSVRFPDSVDPLATDGRDLDPRIAGLEGEAAQQYAAQNGRIARAAWQPATESTDAEPTYYGQPLLKQSVWRADIPLYYFAGGAAGAALTLGAAIQLGSPARRKELRPLSAACHWIGIVGSTAGAVFLVHDLGRASRFLYMLRVFRPTSPMNMGAWILSVAAPSAISAHLLANRLGTLSGYVSGIFGAALASYTGVLVSNTVIPIWQESGRWLPILFAASGGTAAASILDLVCDDEASLRVTRPFGTAARAMEVAVAWKIERVASAIPAVGEPFRHGAPSLLWKAAAAMTAASLVLSLAPGKSRAKTRGASVLGIAGSLCLRFAVHYLGNASSRDPRASFQQQRANDAR